MRKFSFLRVIIAIILIIVISIIVYPYINNLFEEKENTVLECSNLSHITFEQIYEDKTSNETVARDKYLNNSYNFNGTIESINYNEFTKQSYMEIKNVYVIATVYFNENQESKIKNYKKGDSISFCGTVNDISPLIGAIDINNSIIIN